MAESHRVSRMETTIGTIIGTIFYFLLSIVYMSRFQKLSILSLRLGLGFLFFYAGISKILEPGWTSAGYLKAAKTLSPLYHFFASPGIINITNFLNEWGLTLIGLSLLLGVFVRFASIFGILIMFLYYIPILKFPYAGSNSFIIDQHIIYILIFFLLIAFDAEKVWSIKKLIR